MTVTAHIEIDASAVVLDETMAAEPTLEVGVVGVGGVDRSFTPLVRVRDVRNGTSGEELVELLAADPTVAAVEFLSESEDAYLCWIEWADGGLVPEAVFPPSATVAVSALSGRDGVWQYELVCIDEETLSRLNDHWTANEVPVTVRKIVSDVSPAAGQGPLLSETQAEALETALREGYYQIPRGVQLEELASMLGVSHQALSERLRRAHGALVADRFGRDADGVGVADDEAPGLKPDDD